jgi:hypothetical protein
VISSWQSLSHDAKTADKTSALGQKFHISLERSMNETAILATNLGGAAGQWRAVAVAEAIKGSRVE